MISVSYILKIFRLDWLEKHEPGPVPEGYCLSIAYMCLIDCTHSVYSAVEGRYQANNHDNLSNENIDVDGNFSFLFCNNILLL